MSKQDMNTLITLSSHTELLKKNPQTFLFEVGPKLSFGVRPTLI